MDVLVVLVFIASLIQIIYGFFEGSDIPLFPKILYLVTFVLIEILDSIGVLGESHFLEHYITFMLVLQWIWGCIAFKISNENENGFLWGYFLGLIGIIVTLVKQKKWR